MENPPVLDSPNFNVKIEAYRNHVTYKEFTSELKKNKNPWLGVYRGHRFVLIKENDGFFTKLHYIIQRILRFIKVNQKDIDALHQRSEEIYNNIPLVKKLHTVRENFAQLETDLKQARVTISNFGNQIHEIAKQKIDEAGEEARILKLRLEGVLKQAEQDLSKAKEEARNNIKQAKETLESKLAETQAEFDRQLEQFKAKSKSKLKAKKEEIEKLNENIKAAEQNLENSLLEKQNEFEQQVNDWKSKIEKLEHKLQKRKHHKEKDKIAESDHSSSETIDEENVESTEHVDSAPPLKRKPSEKIHDFFHPKKMLKEKIADLEKKNEELQKNNDALSQQWENVENEKELLKKIKTFSRALLDQNNPAFVNKLLDSLTKTHRSQLEEFWQEKVKETKHHHRKSLEIVPDISEDKKHHHRKSKEIEVPVEPPPSPEEPQNEELPEIAEQPE